MDTFFNFQFFFCPAGQTKIRSKDLLYFMLRIAIGAVVKSSRYFTTKRTAVMDFPIVMYHNPDCGTSRNVLHVIRSAGYEPTVILYLQEGWTRSQLLGLFAAARLTPRAALRETKSPAKELGLMEEGVSDETILQAMLEHPILVNRPIVCSPKGVKLCRPSETVLSMLDKLPEGPVFKEDGERII